MFDIGWAELLLLGVVALIVIGPEDLPDMFRQMGRFMAKIRAMGRDFSRAMEQAAKDSGVKDVAKDLQNMTSAKAMGLDKVKQAADRFEKWDPMNTVAKPASAVKTASPLTPPAMPATPAASVVTPPAAGAATQALYDKQAAKQAILKESAEKLKALDAAVPEAAATVPVPVRAARTRSAVKAAEAARPAPPVAEATVAKPKTPRKKKADPS